MKSSYKILISEKLVLKKYQGIVTIHDMKTVFIEAKKLKESYPTFDMLNDYRHALFMFDKNDFVQLMQSFDRNNFPTTAKIFILSSPKQFVIYNFYKDTFKLYNTHVFSSLEASCSNNNFNLNVIQDFFGE
ncbi:MAG: hypothetical protein JKY08_03895 [Flavobacteriaceae bacterium]|nr:hypothetical protein [Flavobacteriaceae bacterium]